MFILLKFDCSGGNPFKIKAICDAIIKTKNCPVYAYISGDDAKGVFAASIMLALACDKIYIAPDASIGAATSENGNSKDNLDLRDQFGERIGEKFTSAYRAYISSLAQKNSRPELLAMAMVDKNIEVVEVQQNGKCVFVSPENIKPSQEIKQRWSRNGALLTLSAEKAVQSGMADEIIESKQKLLEKLGAANAALTIAKEHIEVRGEFVKNFNLFRKMLEEADSLRKKIKISSNNMEKAALLSRQISLYDKALEIARRYPDIPADTLGLQFAINDAKGEYNKIRQKR